MSKNIVVCRGSQARFFSMDDLTYFAYNHYSLDKRNIGIKKADRRLHMHIIGKTGTGKSTLLKNFIMDDIVRGDGVCVLDPHGDLVEDILDHIPTARTRHVVYFNPKDASFPIGLNILEPVEDDLRPLMVSHVISIFKNIWPDFWGPRLEYILSNAVSALLSYERGTLLAIPRLLTDDTFRAQVLSSVTDPLVRYFWKEEYDNYPKNFQREAIAPIQNKVGQLIMHPLMRNMLGQVRSTINLGFMMDNKRILLCNMSRGEIGEDKSALLGSLIVTKLFLSALKRSKLPENARKDFYLYIDECQNLATPVLASILSEARKYRLNLVLTNQYLDQLPKDIQRAVTGNVGSLISFSVGGNDAQFLSEEFSKEYTPYELMYLRRHEICYKMAVDGIARRADTAIRPKSSVATVWCNLPLFP